MLATGQVALALVLLTAAGLLLRSFVALVTFDLGFEPHNVVIARAAEPCPHHRDFWTDGTNCRVLVATDL